MAKVVKLLSADEVGMRTNHTCLKGKLTGINYDNLVETYGEPTYGPDHSGDGKVMFEWVFEYGDEVFTVYSWKVSEDYARHMMGRLDECQFHVGGHTYSGDFESQLECEVLDNILNKA